MRHLKKGKKFHRTASKRRPLLRNLVSNLVVFGSIETTEAKAKAIRPKIEKLITRAKKQTLSSRRLIINEIHNKNVSGKIYEELGPKYAGRGGGYVRIVKIAKTRKRDGSKMARIEFV